MVLAEFVEVLIQWSLAFVQQYGPWSVFFVVILEEVFIPIPSPLVLMGAGFLLIPAGIPLTDAMWQVFWIITIPASIASTIGSFFAYGIGYYGGKPLVMRTKRFIGVGWEDIERAEKRLEKGRKTWVTIAVLRAIPLFPIAVVSLAAGVLRLPKRWYALATFVGSIPRTFVLALVGWWIGGEFIALARKLNVVENILLIGLVIVIAYVLYRFRSRYVHHYYRLHRATAGNLRKVAVYAPPARLRRAKEPTASARRARQKHPRRARRSR